MTTITVTAKQIAAAKLQVALDKADGREPDPRVVKIAEAHSARRTVSRAR